MTGGDVHPSEMPTPDDLDERAVEALLTGRSVATGEVGPLSAFVDDLRVAASGPPPAPTPQLARLLAEGFSVDNAAGRAARSTRRADSSAATRPRQRRRKMTISGLLAGLAAKLGALGLGAQAALGLGLATVGVATAGAAGVLPDPAQHAVATVVNATPFNIPDVTEGDDDAVTETPVPDPIPPVVGDPSGTTDDASDDDGTSSTDTHGACVSAVAHEAPTGAGGVHGEAVSAAAKTCPKGTEPDDGTATTTTSTTVVPDGTTTESTGHGNSRNGHGHDGNGQGQGRGGATAGQGGNPGSLGRQGK